MTAPEDRRPALVALGLVMAASAGWWMLALWPAGNEAPPWLQVTREVCFGVTGDALPDTSGWLLLVGQPIGMAGLLAAVWGRELRPLLARLLSATGGQLIAGAMLAAFVAGLGGVAVRAIQTNRGLLAAGAGELDVPLTRINDQAPALALVDQAGRRVTLESFRGRPVLVAFAYAHCETVCPLVVSDVLSARGRFDHDPPVVLIVTLDPWRDTPARLPSIAKLWALNGAAHVLSGDPDDVERALSAWRVPRTRNQKTGAISHPAMVYVIGADGRITYVVSGNADTIAAAVRAL